MFYLFSCIFLIAQTLEATVEVDGKSYKVFQTGCIDREPLCLEDPDKGKVRTTALEREYEIGDTTVNTALTCCTPNLCNGPDKTGSGQQKCYQCLYTDLETPVADFLSMIKSQADIPSEVRLTTDSNCDPGNFDEEEAEQVTCGANQMCGVSDDDYFLS